MLEWEQQLHSSYVSWPRGGAHSLAVSLNAGKTIKEAKHTLDNQFFVVVVSLSGRGSNVKRRSVKYNWGRGKSGRGCFTTNFPLGINKVSIYVLWVIGGHQTSPAVPLHQRQ